MTARASTELSGLSRNWIRSRREYQKGQALVLPFGTIYLHPMNIQWASCLSLSYSRSVIHCICRHISLKNRPLISDTALRNNKFSWFDENVNVIRLSVRRDSWLFRIVYVVLKCPVELVFFPLSFSSKCCWIEFYLFLYWSTVNSQFYSPSLTAV